MEIINAAVDRYLQHLARPDDDVLSEMEALAAERDFPIVGPQVGRLLALLTRASGATRVLELGSGFGYSAYWFAGAVGPGGQVVMTEYSEEQAAEARSFLERAGVADRVRILVGDALELTGDLEPGFDIVFNDVDKALYARVLEPVKRLLAPGGLFISDNMLWFGKVLEKASADESTRGVQELTHRLFASDEFQDPLILPVRDGVAIARRKDC